MTDSRSPAYVEEHGEHCWEVDALPPTVLRDIITQRLEELVNRDLMREVEEEEETQKDRLKVKLAEMKEER
jgi:hypothetical protein